MDFFENLLKQEMHASERSEAVVFLDVQVDACYSGRLPDLGLPPGTKQRFYYLMCDPTRFLLGRSSTLDGGDWGAQGLGMGLPAPFPGGVMRPDVPDNHVSKNYGPNAGADSIEYR